MSYLEEIIQQITTNSITTLDLNYQHIGAAGAKDIAESLKINHSITILNLDGNEIGPDGAKDIAEAMKINKSVTTLNLCSNKIGAAGAKDIAEALKINNSITTLKLSFNNIGCAGAKDIAEAIMINISVTTLKLGCNKIKAAGAKDIAEALKINQSITKLNLNYNNIGPDGAKHIAEAIKINKSVATLNLAENEMGKAGAKDIAEAIKINNSITTLKLARNDIGCAGVKDIAEAITINHSITNLDLNDNEIGPDGAKDIAEAIKNNKSVTTIKLNYNKIKAAGAKYIAEAMKVNNSITTLILFRNDIGCAGAKDIAEALKINHSITHLDLNDNDIGPDGAKDIAEALKINQSITTFYFARNHIRPDGAMAIAEALKINQFITTLELDDNEIGDAGAKAIAEALKINPFITTLNLNKNQIGYAGAKDIAEALKINRCITTLNHAGNFVGIYKEKVITEALKFNKGLAEKARRDAIATAEKDRMEEVAKLQPSEKVIVKKMIPNILVLKSLKVDEGQNKLDKDDQTTIKEITKLIRDSNDCLQEQCKKGILLLGNTGSGKSTLAHLLSGRKLKALMDDETNELVIDAVQPLKDIVIGHKLASETRTPNKCLVKNQTIWDCPGFNDTDHVQEIANNFYIKRLFETTDEIKFVLVVPELVLNSANARGSIFIETLSSFINSFNDIESIEDSISLVFTHVSPNKNIQHIKKSIDKIITDNQGATDKHKALINKLKDNGSIHLFYKPSREGELNARDLLSTPDLLVTIDTSSKYSFVQGEMVNIAISKKAFDCSFHLLNTTLNNFNQLLEVIVNAVSNATHCSSINPLNAFTENYALVEDWIPPTIHYNNLLPKHDKDEYFSDLDLLSNLQKILSSDEMESISEAIITFQKVVEVFAEYAEPGNVPLQQKIQGYGYCLMKQYECMKFFATVCKAELPEHSKIADLITICHAKVKENLEYQVSSLSIDENQSDPIYYSKAIEYLENYQDFPTCKNSISVAYSCMASISEMNGDQESMLVYYAKAIEANSHLPKIYEKLGQLFYNRGEYAKAINCYKVVNNEFKIKACFKTWLKKNQENPDIMLKQAEYFESIGLFEQAKKYYHHAFSLSQDDNFKAVVLEKIGNIMVNTAAQGQDYITRAKEHDFYNFNLVNEEFIKSLLDLTIRKIYLA